MPRTYNTWHPSPGPWEPAQNIVALRHCAQSLKTQLPFIAQVQGPDLLPGTGTVPEFWWEHLEKSVFTMVPSENHTGAQSVNTV